MPNAVIQAGQEDHAIRAVIEELFEALRAKDVDRILSYYTQNCVIYSLAPPLVTPSDPGILTKWLAGFEGPMRYELRDLSIVSGGDVGYCHGLVRMGGNSPEGEFDLWHRRSFGLRKVDERWLVAHEHESVPFAMDGSFCALTDLEP